MSSEAVLALVICFPLLFLLISLGVPIIWAMMVSGILGFAIVAGVEKSLFVLSYTAWSAAKKEMLICLPLFIIMGRLAFEAGLTGKLFALASSFVGRLKGGLAMAVSIACGLFGAVSGSVLAALGTFGPVAIPELTKYRYNKNFTAVVIAASATFASMIPPSVLFIMYGYITETSIAKLFMAGLFPGIITIVVYCLIIYAMVKRNPSLAPESPPKVSWHQRGRLILTNTPIGFVALIVLGGIYLGWFTPTESAGIGLFLILVLVVASRGTGIKGIANSFLSSGRTTAMIIFLLIGGTCLTAFVAVTGTAAAASEFIASLGLNSYTLIAAIFILYIIWGCFIGDISMLVLVLPVVFPMVEAADISPIWFGVFTVKGLEIASITPPVGINVFVLEGVAKDTEVRSGAIFRFVVPFVIADTVVLALITAFPQICLWLPSTMG